MKPSTLDLVACGRNHGLFNSGNDKFFLIGSKDQLEPLSVIQYKEWELLKNSKDVNEWQEKSFLRKRPKSFREGIEFFLSSGLAIDLDDRTSFNQYMVSRNGIAVGHTEDDKWRINTDSGEGGIHLSREAYLVWISAAGATTIRNVIGNIRILLNCDEKYAEIKFCSYVRLFVKSSLWIIERYSKTPQFDKEKGTTTDFKGDANLIPLGQAAGYLEEIHNKDSGYYVCVRNQFVPLPPEQYIFWISLFNEMLTVHQACTLLGVNKEGLINDYLQPLLEKGLLLLYKDENDLQVTKYIKRGLAIKFEEDNQFVFKTLMIDKSIRVPDVCHKIWSVMGHFDSFNDVVNSVVESFNLSTEEAVKVVSNVIIILMQNSLLSIEV